MTLNLNRLQYFALFCMLLILTACSQPAPAPTPPGPTELPAKTQSATPLPVSPSATAVVSPSPSPSPVLTALPLALPLSSVAYRLPPAIRHIDGESVSFFFELDQPAAGSVFLQAASDNSLVELAFGADTTRQNLYVEGLKPGETYHVLFALIQDGETLQPNFQGRAWGPLTIQTPADDTSLRVGLISDASFGDENTRTMVEAMAAADLDFVIHAGDVVDALEYGLEPFGLYAEAWYSPFEPLLRQMPVYTIPGNHDYDYDIYYEDRPFYFHAFPLAEGIITDSPAMQYYAFIRGGIQFLFLDSQVLYGVPGLEAEEAWLRERLADDSVRFSIPIVHVAPFSSSIVHAEDSLPVQRRWVPLFEEAAVPLVLSGHFHHYERLSQNGITYLVAGGGSAVLYALGTYLPQSKIALRTSHWVLLEFGENSIDITAYGVDGSVLDTYTITNE